MDDEASGAPHRRSPDTSPDKEVVKSGSIRGWRVVQNGGRDTAGRSAPLLANIYLHYVLDLWVNQWRERHANGEVIIVRYADDSVMGFQYRQDAVSFRREPEECMEKFGLEMNADKTHLIEFGRFAIKNRQNRGEGRQETFNFLRLTHICAKRLKDGRFTVKRKTIAKCLLQKVKEVSDGLRRR